MLEYLGSKVLLPIWKDPVCGDGNCEWPWEYPAWGRFGCRAGGPQRGSPWAVAIRPVPAAPDSHRHCGVVIVCQHFNLCLFVLRALGAPSRLRREPQHHRHRRQRACRLHRAPVHISACAHEQCEMEPMPGGRGKAEARRGRPMLVSTVIWVAALLISVGGLGFVAYKTGGQVPMLHRPRCANDGF